MNRIKTLTLSIAEIAEIFAIGDPAVREQAISIIQSAASDPENIDPDRYAGCHPIIQKLIQKLKHRVEMAYRRAEARDRRKAENAAQKAADAAQKPKNNAYETLHRQRAGAKPGTLDVMINESVARRLLWIKQNFPVAVDTVKRILAAYEVLDERARILLANLTDIFNSVTDYLLPLANVANNYFRTPKHLRPSSVTIPAC